MPIHVIAVLISAVIMLIYSVAIRLHSNFNFGILLCYLITGLLFTYGLFYRHIDSFCASGVGALLKAAFFMGVAFFAAMLLFVAISGYSHLPEKNVKAVIVLGAGLKKDKPSGLLQRRLNAALNFYHENPDVVMVVTGGQGRGETLPEGQAMATYLVEHNVPPEKIIVEDKSTSTEENLLLAKKLLKEKGYTENTPVAVVTNAFHCYRGREYAARAGFENISSIPASISPESIPVCYMREVFAVLYYWVFKSSQSSWITQFIGLF